jgi:hypothetical protein
MNGRATRDTIQDNGDGHVFAYRLIGSIFEELVIPDKIARCWRANSSPNTGVELARHYGYQDQTILLISDWNNGSLTPVRVHVGEISATITDCLA